MQVVVFYCHDGQGNYLFHKRSEKCRDEHGCWDCGGGAVREGETLEEALYRELDEEYGVEPIEFEELSNSTILRERNSMQMEHEIHRYRVLVDKDKVVNNEPEKHSELGWYRMDNLPEPLHSLIPGEITELKAKLI